MNRVAEFASGVSPAPVTPGATRTVTWNDLRGNDKQYTMGPKPAHDVAQNMPDDSDDSGSAASGQ